MAANRPFQMDPEQMNLSLNGCGYLGIYHVGVCSCIKKFYPQSLRRKISGGSVGALVACAFMCDVPLDICARYVFDVSMKVRNAILGPMSPDLDIMKLLYESMDAMLPKDAHLHCDGKLHVSATRFETCNNSLLTTFKSREELLQALMCSCFIPFYCGYQPPEFYGIAYCDAALSNNSPWLNEYTVTVAPFSGNSDICPQNDGFFLTSLKLSNTSIGINTKNIYMLFRVLFPASPEVQKDICQQGYNDGLRYLRDNNLIPCTNCKSAGPVPNHAKCEIPQDAMPVEISNEIERAVAELRKGFLNQILQMRPVKYLYYCNMPSIMTFKVAYVIISTIAQKVQIKSGIGVDEIWRTFLRVLRSISGPSNNSISHTKQSSTNKRLEKSTRVQIENLTELEINQNAMNEAITQQANESQENCEVIVNSDTPTPKRKDIFRKKPNNYSSKREISIHMTSGQSCQRELPRSNNNIDTKVNKYMKTCVF